MTFLLPIKSKSGIQFEQFQWQFAEDEYDFHSLAEKVLDFRNNTQKPFIMPRKHKIEGEKCCGDVEFIATVQILQGAGPRTISNGFRSRFH